MLIRSSLWSLLVLLIHLVLAHVAPGSVGEVEIRSVLPLDAAQRARLARLVESDPEAGALFQLRQTRGLALLTARPSPLEKIFYEGLVHTDPRRVKSVEHLRDMDDLAALLEWWQASGDRRAASKGVEYLLAWTQTYVPTGNDVNDAKLLPVLVAAIAWRSELSADDQQRLDTWIQRFGQVHRDAAREQKDKRTNRYSKRLIVITMTALALDRKEWLDDVRQEYARFVASALSPDGTSEDLRRRDTLTYHCSMLRPLLDLAMLLQVPGSPDLYRQESDSGASVRKSVLYVVPFADGSKQRREWVNTTVELDRQRAAAGLEEYKPGRLFDPKDSLKMLEQASFFEPELIPLVARLSESGAKRFPTWRSVVQQAMRNS